MDELTKGMEEFIKKTIEPIPEETLRIMKQEIDTAAQDVYDFLKTTTPVGRSGGLLKSLQKNRSNKREYYGYDIEYVGEDDKGVPYQKIANILNYGTNDKRIPAKYFLKRAQRRLKGLDEKINERIGSL